MHFPSPEGVLQLLLVQHLMSEEPEAQTEQQLITTRSRFTRFFDGRKNLRCKNSAIYQKLTRAKASSHGATGAASSTDADAGSTETTSGASGLETTEPTNCGVARNSDLLATHRDKGNKEQNNGLVNHGSRDSSSKEMIQGPRLSSN